MIKCCDNCKNAVYDSVPWGMGTTSYLSGCKVDDKMAEELPDEEIDLIMDGEKECPYWQACRE